MMQSMYWSRILASDWYEENYQVLVRYVSMVLCDTMHRTYGHENEVFMVITGTHAEFCKTYID